MIGFMENNNDNDDDGDDCHIHGMQPMCAYMYTVNNQENYSC